jgi:hypothetical protein
MDNKDMPAMPKGLVVTEGGDIYGNEDSELGLTKREHFAGLAMQAILSNSCLIDNLTTGSVDWLVKKAAIVADAQLAELDKDK